MSFIKKSIICLLILCGIGSLWPFVRPKPATPILFSVVMPVYNREDLVSRAIRSVLAQSYDRFEFIIVDDGSSDKTAEIVRRFAQNDARIRLVTHAQNKGISAARNTGNDTARGDFITVMDSDDWMHPYLLEKTADLLKRFPDTDLVFSDSFKLNNKNWNATSGDISQLKIMPKFPLYFLFYNNSIGNVGNSFRRSFIKKNQIRYNQNMMSAEDYDFWVQMIMKGVKVKHLDEPLVSIHIHRTNSQTYYEKMEKGREKVSQKLHDFYDMPEFPMRDKCHLIRHLQKRNDSFLPKNYLTAAEKKLCPPSNKPYFRLIYATSVHYFVPSDDIRGQSIYRTGKYQHLNDNQLRISWDGLNTDTFQKNDDGDFVLIE